jgi:hypothetical protein
MLVTVGWVLASLSLNLVETILRRIFPQVGHKSLVISYFLTSGLILFFLYTFLTPLVNNTLSEVYANGSDPESGETPKFSPQIVTVSNDVLGEHKFDIRNITDAVMVGVVGKAAISAMSHAPTIGGKAVLATSTALGLGAVAMGLKSMNKARSNPSKISNDSNSSNGRPTSPTNDNFTINSPHEETISDNLMVVFQVVQVLLITALVLFIVFIFFLWLKSKLDTVTAKDVCHFWTIQEENAEWIVSKVKAFLDKNLKFYLISFTILIFFNLGFALYFVTDLANFLSAYRF